MTRRGGFVVWLTGVPASGKSTIAALVERELVRRSVPVENLDADAVRSVLSPDLGWSLEARDENTRRLAWIAALLAKHGVGVLVPAVSSLRRFRDRARSMTPRFCEVHVDAPFQAVQARDPKGLYARAARGEVSDVAGLHQPYELPLRPEVVCATDRESPGESARKVLRFLEAKGWVARARGIPTENLAKNPM